jgi:hypothetical protein
LTSLYHMGRENAIVFRGKRGVSFETPLRLMTKYYFQHTIGKMYNRRPAVRQIVKQVQHQKTLQMGISTPNIF